MSAENQETQTVSGKKVIGQAKWFNDKCGYGFINYPYGEEGTDNGSKDIFVHFSNISPQKENSYKALYTGEYVVFEISNAPVEVETETKEIRNQAVNVTGIGGGMLMNEYRGFISSLSSDGTQRAPRPPRNFNSFRGGKGGGRGGKGFGNRPPPHFGGFTGNPPDSLEPKEEWTPKP